MECPQPNHLVNGHRVLLSTILALNELEVATKHTSFLVSRVGFMKCIKEGAKCSVVQRSAVQGIAVQCGVVQCCSMQYSAMQCSVVHLNKLLCCVGTMIYPEDDEKRGGGGELKYVLLRIELPKLLKTIFLNNYC